MSKDKTFVRITNREIYDKLVCIEKLQIKTNGKVLLNSRLTKILFALVFIIIVAMFRMA